MTAQRSAPEQAPLSIIHEQAALACPLVDEATLDEMAMALLEYGEEDLSGLAVVQEIAGLVATPGQQSAPRTQAQIADATLLAIEARRGGVAAGLPTGVPGLERIHGFRPGHFVVLAARPAVGKTLLAYQMAQHMTAAGHTGLYVSLEMDAEELQERALVAESMVPATALGAADMLTEDHWAALLRAGQTLGTRPLHVIDAGGVTLDTVLSWTRRYQATAGLAFLVLDYVQLLPMPNPDRVSEAAALSAITKRLKATARQLGICIIALSQLNRPGEGARPGLVNLRGSDTLGHDADLVLMLWPNEEAGTDGYSGDGVRHLVLDVRKNRQGPEPTVHMVFNPVTLTMREVTH
jgi:replicative DNA helicase